MTRLAINGFGRIGRAAFKIALEHADEAEVVAINDLGDINNLAYLLKYDSVYGRYNRTVEVSGKDLVVDGKTVKVFAEKDPSKLPWGDLQVDVVIESTGVFTEADKARLHLQGGAKKVIISAPTKSNELKTVVLGVNDDDMSGQEIISNASCTTNCVSPVMAILENAFGVEKGLMTTAHAMTATQSLVDGPATKDFRRGRAANANIVPSTTGAAEAVIRTMPKLDGKFDGISLRVPVIVVSIADFSVLLKKKVSVEEVNKAFEDAAAHPLYQGVVAVTRDPVVSSDFIGDPHSAIVDLELTRVVDGDFVKVMAWYDNEWGYSNRLVEQAIALAAHNG